MQQESLQQEGVNIVFFFSYSFSLYFLRSDYRAEFRKVRVRCLKENG